MKIKVISTSTKLGIKRAMVIICPFKGQCRTAHLWHLHDNIYKDVHGAKYELPKS